jgi:hypothetical protein
MYRLTTHIEIGNSPNRLIFDYVNYVQVAESADTLTNTCTITLPRNLNLAGKNIKELIPQGAPVSVEIGYNDDNRCVFEGFVKQVKPGVPVTISCEDDMYRLKKIKVANETIQDFELKAFLSRYLPSGLDTDNVTELSLGELRISKEPTLAKLLSEFKEKYGLQFFFRGGVFYGVLPSTKSLMAGISTHKIKFNYNIISENLEYKLVDDFKLIVKAKAILKNNELLEVQEPSGETDGNIATYFSATAKTKAELTAFAKEKLKSYQAEGLTGSVTLFGIPYVQVADHVILLDDNNAERNNKKYLVRGITRNFGTGGYRQTVKLGELISQSA